MPYEKYVTLDGEEYCARGNTRNYLVLFRIDGYKVTYRDVVLEEATMRITDEDGG